MDVVSPNCVFLFWAYKHDMYLQFFMPIAVGFANASHYMLAKLVYSLRLPPFRILRLLNIAPADKVELIELRDELLMKVVTFINTLYLVLVRYSVAPFVCSKVAPGLEVLEVYPSIECHTAEHQELLGVCSVALLVYAVGFPLFVAVTLVRIHKTQLHSSKESLRKFGQLYDSYKPHAFGFELINLTKRGGFGIISVFSSTPQMQCLVGQCLLLLQFVVQVRLPYFHSFSASGTVTRYGRCRVLSCRLSLVRASIGGSMSSIQSRLSPYCYSHFVACSSRFQRVRRVLIIGNGSVGSRISVCGCSLCWQQQHSSTKYSRSSGVGV